MYHQFDFHIADGLLGLLVLLPLAQKTLRHVARNDNIIPNPRTVVLVATLKVSSSLPVLHVGDCIIIIIVYYSVGFLQ